MPAIICLLFLLSCGKDDEGHEAPIAFHVSMSEVEAFTATATITHNGSNRDYYYGFFVEGKVSNSREEVSRLLASGRAADVLSTPYNQRKRVLKVSGLSPKKTFTYIVFGLNAEGEIHGEPGMAEFTTIPSSITARVNPNWTVTHQGHTVYNDWDYSLINVKVYGEVSERFFLAVYEASKPSTFSTVEDFIFYATDEFTKQKNAGGDDDFWLDDSKIRTESTNFYRYLEPGDYVAYAIGLTVDGTPTGSYAKSEPFNVDKYPYTDAYANLVDNYWAFEDGSGKKYVVDFSERIVNRSLIMTGWGNHDEFDIVMNYDRNTHGLTISSQRITNDEVTVHFSDGDETGTIYLFGAYYNAQDQLKWTNQSHTIAKGTIDDNGNYIFASGYYVTLDDADTRASNLGMSFVMYQGSTPALGFSRMMFPFTLTKIE